MPDLSIQRETSPFYICITLPFAHCRLASRFSSSRKKSCCHALRCRNRHYLIKLSPSLVGFSIFSVSSGRRFFFGVTHLPLICRGNSLSFWVTLTVLLRLSRFAFVCAFPSFLGLLRVLVFAPTPRSHVFVSAPHVCIAILSSAFEFPLLLSPATNSAVGFAASKVKYSRALFRVNLEH